MPDWLFPWNMITFQIFFVVCMVFFSFTIKLYIYSGQHDRQSKSFYLLLIDQNWLNMVLLTPFFVKTYEIQVYVAVNFFIAGNFYISLVSTSLAYISISKNKRKTKITWDKKLTVTYTYNDDIICPWKDPLWNYICCKLVSLMIHICQYIERKNFTIIIFYVSLPSPLLSIYDFFASKLNKKLTICLFFFAHYLGNC